MVWYDGVNVGFGMGAGDQAAIVYVESHGGRTFLDPSSTVVLFLPKTFLVFDRNKRKQSDEGNVWVRS
jgi:hypothetical protein